MAELCGDGSVERYDAEIMSKPGDLSRRSVYLSDSGDVSWLHHG
jgi:hypothetical protein